MHAGMLARRLVGEPSDRHYRRRDQQRQNGHHNKQTGHRRAICVDEAQVRDTKETVPITRENGVCSASCMMLPSEFLFAIPCVPIICAAGSTSYTWCVTTARPSGKKLHCRPRQYPPAQSGEQTPWSRRGNSGSIEPESTEKGVYPNARGTKEMTARAMTSANAKLLKSAINRLNVRAVKVINSSPSRPYSTHPKVSKFQQKSQGA